MYDGYVCIFVYIYIYVRMHCMCLVCLHIYIHIYTVYSIYYIYLLSKGMPIGPLKYAFLRGNVWRGLKAFRIRTS